MSRSCIYLTNQALSGVNIYDTQSRDNSFTLQARPDPTYRMNISSHDLIFLQQRYYFFVYKLKCEFLNFSKKIALKSWMLIFISLSKILVSSSQIAIHCISIWKDDQIFSDNCFLHPISTLPSRVSPVPVVSFVKMWEVRKYVWSNCTKPVISR